MALAGALLGCTWVVACAGSSPTAGPPKSAPVVRRVMLLAPSDEPAFFAGPAPDAPAVGFGSAEAKLVLRGPAEHGRVPVRVHGRVTLEAYVPERLLELRVQTTEFVRGTPVLVAPGDRVRVLGPADEPGHVRVSVQPRLGEERLGPFEGSLPSSSLAANEPSPGAALPEPGMLYRVPPGVALPLYDQPEGELIALLPIQGQGHEVSVTAVQGNWFSVRAGTGPYLVGHTNEPLTLVGKPAEAARPNAAPAQPARGALPPDVAEVPGELKQLPAGAKLTFRGKPLATLRSPGWARVIANYPDGTSEVIAAADEQVTVRGLVRTDELTDPVSADFAALQPSETARALRLSPARE